MEAEKLIGLIVLGLAACSIAPPKPTRYLIENGTVGWVRITYNRSDAPALPVEDGFAVVRITQDMKLATRTRMNPSWDRAEFYYQTADGKRVRLTSTDDNQRSLWGLEKTSDADGQRETFFVGKQDKFTHMDGAVGDMGTGLMSPKSPDPEKKDGILSDDRMRIQTELPK